MPINPLSTANTFEQWLIATQSLIQKSNYYEDRTNLVFETANTTSNIANLVFANAAIVNAQTTIVLTSAATINTILTNANNYANSVNLVAQNAYNTANLAFNLAANASNLIYEVFDDTSNNVTLYPALFLSNTGTPNTAFVSSTKLYYNPSTGQLSASNFDSLSDFSKKKDIETISDALTIISSLRGVSFNWKENNQKSMGLIAQEVEKVIPEVVFTNDRGEKSITYGSIIGLLIEGIKEINKKVEEISKNINK